MFFGSTTSSAATPLSLMPSLLDQHAQDEQTRQARLADAWNRYYGAHPLSIGPSRSDPRATDGKAISKTRRTVDTGARFLFGQGVKVTVDAGDNDAPDAPDAYLDQFWAANRMTSKLLDIAINGGVTGDAFVKLVPSVQAGKPPRLVVLDSANVTVLLDPQDWERVIEYRISWIAIDPVSGKPVAYRQVYTEADDGTWAILDQQSAGDSNQWITTRDEAWPYTWPPIFHCKNHAAPCSYWGTSDIEGDVLDLNDKLSFAAANISRILRTHAHPRTIGTGFEASQMANGIDDVTILHAPEARLYNLEMQSDLSSSLAYLTWIEDEYDEATGIPKIAAGKVENLGQLSGLALKVLYGPLLASTQTKQVLYGALIEDLCRAVLDLGGIGYDHAITIHWPDPLPKSVVEEANAALGLIAAGVSKATVLSEIGYDPDEEAAKRADEQAEAQAAQDRSFNAG